MKSASPPPAPDPSATSMGQTQTNVGTAVANTALKNADVYGPTGSSTFQVNGHQTIQQPTFDKQGNITGYQPIDVPTYRNDITLSPEQQGLYDQQVALGGQMNTIAGNELGQLSNSLSTPLNTDGLPQLQTANTDYSGFDYDTIRNQQLDLLRQRADPELDRQYQQRQTQLANQGVNPESEAYREAIALSDRQRNDADLGFQTQAGTEANNAFGMDLARRQAEQSAIGFNNNVANQALQQRLTLRSQPVNEISSLMNGGQVSMPQFQPYQGGSIAPTDTSGNIYKSYQADYNTYLQQMQQQNAFMSGLFGLGTAGIMAL